jgi:Polyketide cyclase / dehydrase and lipid transport
MSQVTRSTVIEGPITEIWDLLRDFNNYPKYIEGVTESHIEDGRPGDAVGAVRAFVYGGATIRQRLSALSDDDHCFSYVGLDPFPFPGRESDPAPEPVDYRGTLRLTKIGDGDTSTFVQWQVTYEGSAAPDWRRLLSDLIDQWLDSLRRAVQHT